ATMQDHKGCQPPWRSDSPLRTRARGREGGPPGVALGRRTRPAEVPLGERDLPDPRVLTTRPASGTPRRARSCSSSRTAGPSGGEPRPPPPDRRDDGQRRQGEPLVARPGASPLEGQPQQAPEDEPEQGAAQGAQDHLEQGGHLASSCWRPPPGYNWRSSGAL